MLKHNLRADGNRWRRRLVRCAVLAAAVALLWPGWLYDWAPLAVPSLSPYVAVAAAIAAHMATCATLLALPLAGLAIFWPRGFCRWLCPTGLLIEAAGRFPAAALGATAWHKQCFPRGRLSARHCLCQAVAHRVPKFARPRRPNVGVWLVLVTLGGACLGYPLLVWLDPLAIFAAAVNTLGREVWRDAWLAGGALPLLLLAGWLWPGLWCGRICPLGATQDLLALPAHAARRARQGKSRPPGGWLILRRTVLGMGFGGLAAAGLMRVAAARPRPLRPPGAAGEYRAQRVVRALRQLRPRLPQPHHPPRLGPAGGRVVSDPLDSFRRFLLPGDLRALHAGLPGAGRSGRFRPKKTLGGHRPAAGRHVAVFTGRRSRMRDLRNSHCPYGAIRIVFCEADYRCVPQVDPHRCNGCGAAR